MGTIGDCKEQILNRLDKLEQKLDQILSYIEDFENNKKIQK